jgi:hypothetical protein
MALEVIGSWDASLEIVECPSPLWRWAEVMFRFFHVPSCYGIVAARYR